MNILIKLMSIVSLVIAPSIGHPLLHYNMENVVSTTMIGAANSNSKCCHPGMTMSTDGQGNTSGVCPYMQHSDCAKTVGNKVMNDVAPGDISLGCTNVTPGSVMIMAGTDKLTENTDYTVDYTSGKVKITNQAIISSGKHVDVSYSTKSASSEDNLKEQPAKI
jgi:hypothetical protein